MRWQYHIRWTEDHISDTNAEVEADLTELGQDGWELVGFDGWLVMVFKRPVESGPLLRGNYNPYDQEGQG